MALAPNGATTFGLSEPAADQYGLREVDGQKWLCRGESRITNHESLKIFGLHNAANALPALALEDAAGIAREASLAALRSFGRLPHCCQFVAFISDGCYSNASMRTIVGSTRAALNRLPTPIWWIGGCP